MNRMDNDTISRQAAILAIEEYADRLQMVNWKENPGVPYKAHALNWAINTLRDLPSAERRGQWEFNIDDKGWSWDKPYMCDQCGERVEKESKFCPSCGASMIGECSTCPTAQNTNLEDDDSPCRDCEVEGCQIENC